MFLNMIINDFLEVKEYRSVEMLFLFVAGSVDEAGRRVEEAPLTQVHYGY